MKKKILFLLSLILPFATFAQVPKQKDTPVAIQINQEDYIVDRVYETSSSIPNTNEFFEAVEQFQKIGDQVSKNEIILLYNEFKLQ